MVGGQLRKIKNPGSYPEELKEETKRKWEVRANYMQSDTKEFKSFGTFSHTLEKEIYILSIKLKCIVVKKKKTVLEKIESLLIFNIWKA